MNGTSAGKLIVVNRTSGTLWRLQTWHLMRLTGNGSEFSLYGTWHGPQFITTSSVDLKIVKKLSDNFLQRNNDSVKVSYECIFPEIGKYGRIQTHCYALFILSICICLYTLFCCLVWITWVKGPFTLSESEHECNFFFDLCRCFIWTSNWILYQSIWKRCRFCFRATNRFVIHRLKVCSHATDSSPF